MKGFSQEENTSQSLLHFSQEKRGICCRQQCSQGLDDKRMRSTYCTTAQQASSQAYIAAKLSREKGNYSVWWGGGRGRGRSRSSSSSNNNNGRLASTVDVRFIKSTVRKKIAQIEFAAQGKETHYSQELLSRHQVVKNRTNLS